MAFQDDLIIINPEPESQHNTSIIINIRAVNGTDHIYAGASASTEEFTSDGIGELNLAIPETSYVIINIANKRTYRFRIIINSMSKEEFSKNFIIQENGLQIKNKVIDTKLNIKSDTIYKINSNQLLREKI